MASYIFDTATITTSATEVQEIDMGWSDNTSQKISILEKAHRLPELHDADLIDITQIQQLAANLGYNISVSRNEVGGFGTTFGTPSPTEIATSATDRDRYLRFMTGNLPNIYKIKATDSDIQMMLYSFGLVGDLVKYYTDNYLPTNDGGNWAADFEKDLSTIPNTYYTTPHFALVIEVDDSTDLIVDVGRRASLIRAVESIRPINTVFRKLTGHATRSFPMFFAMKTRLCRYIRIKQTD